MPLGTNFVFDSIVRIILFFANLNIIYEGQQIEIGKHSHSKSYEDMVSNLAQRLANVNFEILDKIQVRQLMY